MDMRKIQNADAEKCEILASIVKDLRLVMKEKDEIISKLNGELEAAANLLKKAETEISDANRLLEKQNREFNEVLMGLNDDILKQQEKLKLKASNTNNSQMSSDHPKCSKQLTIDETSNNLRDIQGTTVKPMEQAHYTCKSQVKVSENEQRQWEPRHNLIKHSPLRTDGFVSQTQKEGTVMMVYGLDNEISNPDKLFNLFCLYGNVARIQILSGGTAMVEMQDSMATKQCVQNIKYVNFGRNGRMHITHDYKEFHSVKQEFVQLHKSPYLLPDQTPSYKDYTACKDNRFLTLERASKNCVLPLNKTLYFYNVSLSFTKTHLMTLFNSRNIKPTSILYIHKGKSTAGLIEFENISDSVLAIMQCNNMLIKDTDTNFFKLKLAFARLPIYTKMQSNERELK